MLRFLFKSKFLGFVEAPVGVSNFINGFAPVDRLDLVYMTIVYNI